MVAMEYETGVMRSPAKNRRNYDRRNDMGISRDGRVECRLCNSWPSCTADANDVRAATAAAKASRQVIKEHELISTLSRLGRKAALRFCQTG